MDWKTRREIEEAIDSSGVVKDDGNSYMEIVSFICLLGLLMKVHGFVERHLSFGIAESVFGVALLFYLVGRIFIGKIVADTVFTVALFLGIYSIVS